MRIGVTGSSGVLGRILSMMLARVGHEVSAFPGDVRLPAALSTWVQNDFDCIFHLAAIVAIDDVNKSPFTAFHVKFGGTIHLLSALEVTEKRPWLFLASSSHVYAPSSLPVKEDGKVEPSSAYGRSKKHAEDVCLAYAEQESSRVCVGRIFSLFHDSQSGSFLYPSWKAKLHKCAPYTTYEVTHGDDVRDFQSAETIADTMVALMDCGANGIFNIGSGKGQRVIDFVQRINPAAKLVSVGSRIPNVLVADTTKTNLLLKIR